MIDMSSIPPGKLVIGQYTLDIRHFEEDWASWKKQLGYALYQCQYFVGYKLVVAGIYFNAIAETEVWFDDSYPDLKVTMVAVVR